jgi:hypothetical protein
MGALPPPEKLAHKQAPPNCSGRALNAAISRAGRAYARQLTVKLVDALLVAAPPVAASGLDSALVQVFAIAGAVVIVIIGSAANNDADPMPVVMPVAMAVRMLPVAAPTVNPRPWGSATRVSVRVNSNRAGTKSAAGSGGVSATHPATASARAATTSAACAAASNAIHCATRAAGMASECNRRDRYRGCESC